MVNRIQLCHIVGHYNPLHEYPYYVVPIFQTNDGGLAAVYWSSGELSISPIDDQTWVVPFTKETAENLQNYNPNHFGLFAFSEEHVVSYRRDKADWFIRKILSMPELVGANPFVKLSLAKTAGLMDKLPQLARSCVLELGGNSSDGFAESWFSEVRKDFRTGLPSNFKELLHDTNLVTVACLRGDEPLLLNFSRIVNDSHYDNICVLPEVIDWLPNDNNVTPLAIDAILREIKFREEGPGLFPLVSGEHVLAVREEYLKQLELTPSWESVMREAVKDESFRWVRPRAGSASGDLVEWALNDIFGTDERVGSKNFNRKILAERVKRYALYDGDAAEAAIEWGEWNVNAVVVKRHAALRLFSQLSGKNRAVLISYREPLYISYAIDISRSNKNNTRGYYLQKLCSSETLNYQFRIAGLSHPFNMAAQAKFAQEAFARINERPVAVCLVVDVSSSMSGEKIDAAKQGIAALIGFLSSDRRDAVGMITFSNNAQRIVPMGCIDEIGETVAARTRALGASGRTSLLDAVILACNEVAGWPSHVPIIIVVTDGQENQSSHTLEDVERCLRQNSNMPAILGLAYGEDADYVLLRHLAGMTRGTVLKGSVLNIVQLYQHLVGLL